jgi:phage tail sheath protein FI
MVQYYSPGVFIEEVETGPVPIQGVATSVTGAVGVTAQGPTSGKPILVTSFNDFQKTFGGFIPTPTDPKTLNKWADPVEGGSWWLFPLAVKGFFDNGGQQLYVKRVTSAAARASSAALGRGLIAEVDKNASKTDTVIQLRHLFDVSKTKSITPVFNGSPLAAVTANWYDPLNRTVGLSAATNQALQAGRDSFQIDPVSPAPVDPTKITLIFSAKATGTWGDSLAVRVRPVVGATLSILPNTITNPTPFATSVVSSTAVFTITLPAGTAIHNGDTVSINNQSYTVSGVTAGPPLTFTVTAAVADGLQSLGSIVPMTIVPAGGGAGTPVKSTAMSASADVTVTVSPGMPAGIDHVLIQGRIFPITATAAGATTFTITPDQLSSAAWPANVVVSWARPARVTTVNIANDTIDLKDASQLYANALVELDNGSISKEFRVVQSINNNSVTFGSGLTNSYNEGQKVRVLEAEVGVQLYGPDGSVVAQETFSNLRLSFESGLNFLVNNVNQFSNLVTVKVGPGLWTDPNKMVFDNQRWFPTAPGGGWLPLTNGDDAVSQLSPDDFVGVDGGSGNRTGIQALEDIDNISICVVPGMWSSSVQSALINFCETLRDRFAIIDPPDGLDIGGIQSFRAPYDSKYAALYYPWLIVRDPSIKQNVHVPPSAHLAGIYAQTDNTRGVFKAPANVVVSGIVLAATPPQHAGFAQDISQREQDVLNPIGINALRYFPNRGYRVWGARTLSSDTTWKYINVRRIFIYVEKSILVGTQWVVFEPNDEGTWSRVRQSVSEFLTSFWRQGGLQGATAKEAFFVACDLGVTMTQDDIDNGRLIVQVGIAPVKPAEFVIFQIQQYTQEAKAS